MEREPSKACSINAGTQQQAAAIDVMASKVFLSNQVDRCLGFQTCNAQKVSAEHGIERKYGFLCLLASCAQVCLISGAFSKDGRRRVNYYIKYLVVNPENKFDQ
eukprot:4473266-Amphidinium_carterae.2